MSTPLSNSETPLERRLKRLIAASGPIDLATYMSLCLADPEHGYYTKQRPIGAAGDFTTAPEISQLFGELIAVWMLRAWQQSGSPTPFHLVELGPGRGTLMQDMARTIQSQPDAFAALTIHLVEISPTLRAQQDERLKALDCPVTWHDSIDSLPDEPIFLLANEFFDCLPIHQWVRNGHKWHERVVSMDDNGNLAFGLGPVRALTSEAIDATGNATEDAMGNEIAAEGAILEQSPASTAIMTTLANKLASHGGAGLFIDYGYTKPGYGDTFQAMRNHAYADPLARPGALDLTAHVNFAALAKAAASVIKDSESALAVAPPMNQGDFLLSMGLLERAGQLGAGRSYEEQEAIRDAVERLAAPDQMGDLFHCLAILPNGCPIPPLS
nr:class I SAM-dependent methyltransferase [uncultured Cohaesibacter sp.]